MGSAHSGEGTQDRVYLDGSTLRRRRLAVAAPPQLLKAVRYRRHRVPAATRSSDAPSLRVRRVLAWNNALLLILALTSTVALVILNGEAAVESSYRVVRLTDKIGSTFITLSMIAFFPGTLVLVFSRMAGRPRGLTTGISAISFSIAFSVLLQPSLDDTELTLLTVGRLLTLATTVAALLPAGQGVAVPWPTFQRRCKRAFVLSGGFIVLATGWLVIVMTTSPLDFDKTLLGPLMLAGFTASGTIVLAAAYFAGVRYTPLVAGGAMLVHGGAATLANQFEMALGFGLPGLLVLGAFYWQIRRTAERPPREPWETRWRKWRWPLAIISAVAITYSALFFEYAAPAILTIYICSAFLVLNPLVEFLSDRFCGAVTRFRGKSPFVLHFD